MSYELIITCVPESHYKDTTPRYPHCRGLKSVKENGRIMSGNVENQTEQNLYILLIFSNFEEVSKNS